eukprot:Selendium_serpulae@DN4879_c0_g1_i2.p1
MLELAPQRLNRRERLRPILQYRFPLLYMLMTPDRVQRMHLDTWKSSLQDFQNQRLHRSLCPMRSYYGSVSSIWMLLFGLILIILGLITLLTGAPYANVTIPYDATDTLVEFSVVDEMRAPVFVYYGVKDFYSNFRAYQISKPRDIYPTYSCGEFTSRAKFDEVRPAGSLPEIDNLGNSTGVYPCGLTSFSIYNDMISLYHHLELPPGASGVGQQEIFVDRSDTAPWTNFVLYSGNPQHDYFVSPFQQAYRVWLPPMFSSTFKKLYGVIYTPLYAGTYTLRLDQNEWPAEEWISRKNIQLETHGPFGTSQIVVTIIYFCTGFLILVISALVYVGSRKGWQRGGRSLLLVSPDRLSVKARSVLRQR